MEYYVHGLMAVLRRLKLHRCHSGVRYEDVEPQNLFIELLRELGHRGKVCKIHDPNFASCVSSLLSKLYMISSCQYTLSTSLDMKNQMLYDAHLAKPDRLSSGSYMPR